VLGRDPGDQGERGIEDNSPRLKEEQLLAGQPQFTDLPDRPPFWLVHPLPGQQDLILFPFKGEG